MEAPLEETAASALAGVVVIWAGSVKVAPVVVPPPVFALVELDVELLLPEPAEQPETHAAITVAASVATAMARRGQPVVRVLWEGSDKRPPHVRQGSPGRTRRKFSAARDCSIWLAVASIGSQWLLSGLYPRARTFYPAPPRGEFLSVRGCKLTSSFGMKTEQKAGRRLLTVLWCDVAPRRARAPLLLLSTYHGYSVSFVGKM